MGMKYSSTLRICECNGTLQKVIFRRDPSVSKADQSICAVVPVIQSIRPNASNEVSRSFLLIALSSCDPQNSNGEDPFTVRRSHRGHRLCGKPQALALYCSSLTFSSHSAALPFRLSWIAVCVIAIVGEAPCQCFSPAGIQTISPG